MVGRYGGFWGCPLTDHEFIAEVRDCLVFRSHKLLALQPPSVMLSFAGLFLDGGRIIGCPCSLELSFIENPPPPNSTPQRVYGGEP